MICDTSSIVVGSKGTTCSICGLWYHFACEQFTTYFKTSATWKWHRCEIVSPGRGRGRDVRVRGRERAIIEEEI